MNESDTAMSIGSFEVFGAFGFVEAGYIHSDSFKRRSEKDQTMEASVFYLNESTQKKGIKCRD